MRAFETDYPYIKVNFVTAGGPKTLNRITAEYRAGSHLYDAPATAQPFSRQRARLAWSCVPYAAEGVSPPRLRRSRGLLQRDLTRAFMFIVNKNLVAAKDYPKSFASLLEPRWKGKLAMDNESYDLLAAMFDHYGETEGKRMAGEPGPSGAEFSPRYHLVGQLVAAGEFSIMVDGSNHLGYELKKKGAPIEYIFPEPFMPVMIPQGSGSLPGRLIRTQRRCSSISCCRKKPKRSWPTRAAG